MMILPDPTQRVGELLHSSDIRAAMPLKLQSFASSLAGRKGMQFLLPGIWQETQYKEVGAMPACIQHGSGHSWHLPSTSDAASRRHYPDKRQPMPP